MQVSTLHQQSSQWVMPAQGKSAPEREKQASAPEESAQKSSKSSQPVTPTKTENTDTTKTSSSTLSQEQLDMIAQLKARDSEVRAHEAAHLAAAGSYATSGASYSTQKGPDGRAYAIGGEVGIDTSAVPNDPEATMRKADVVIRAALAPSEPSGQDLKVAQAAQQMRVQAMTELAQQRTEKLQNNDVSSPNPSTEVQKNSAGKENNRESQSTSATESWRSIQAKDRYQSTMQSFSSSNTNTIGFSTQA